MPCDSAFQYFLSPDSDVLTYGKKAFQLPSWSSMTVADIQLFARGWSVIIPMCALIKILCVSVIRYLQAAVNDFSLEWSFRNCSFFMSLNTCLYYLKYIIRCCLFAGNLDCVVHEYRVLSLCFLYALVFHFMIIGTHYTYGSFEVRGTTSDHEDLEPSFIREMYEVP